MQSKLHIRAAKVARLFIDYKRFKEIIGKSKIGLAPTTKIPTG